MDSKIRYTVLFLLAFSGFANGMSNDIESRQGFRFDFGAGIGENFVTPHVKIDDEINVGTLRVNGSFYGHMGIGAFITDDIGLAYANKMDIMAPFGRLIINDANVIEFTHFISRLHNRFYYTLSLGFSTWMYPTNLYWNEHYKGIGPCSSAGVGIRLDQRVSISAEYQFSKPIHRYEILSTGTSHESDSYFLEYKQSNYIHSVHLMLLYRLL